MDEYEEYWDDTPVVRLIDEKEQEEDSAAMYFDVPLPYRPLQLHGNIVQFPSYPEIPESSLNTTNC